MPKSFNPKTKRSLACFEWANVLYLSNYKLFIPGLFVEPPNNYHVMRYYLEMTKTLIRFHAMRPLHLSNGLCAGFV